MTPMTPSAGPVTVDAARLAYLERVERAAAHELLMAEAQGRHEVDQTADIDQWNREDLALYGGRIAAYEALHAALAARPEGEDPAR